MECVFCGIEHSGHAYKCRKLNKNRWIKIKRCVQFKWNDSWSAWHLVHTFFQSICVSFNLKSWEAELLNSMNCVEHNKIDKSVHLCLSLSHFVFQWIIIWHIQIECGLSSGNDSKSVLDPNVSMLSVQCSMLNAQCFWFYMIELFWKHVFFLMQKPIPILSILRLFLLSSSLCRYGCCFIAHKALTDLFTKWKHSMDTSNRKLNRFSPISCENFLIVYLSLFFFCSLDVVFIVTACQRQCGMDVFFPLVVIATRRAIQSRSKTRYSAILIP